MAKQSTSRPPEKQSASAARRARSGSGGKWLWIGLGVVVVAFVAIAVATRSDDPATSDIEVAAVTVTGDSLPEYAGAGAPDPAVGQTAPELSGKTFDGTAISIKNDGTAKVVVFAAHWCPHCQKEIPLLVEHEKTSPMPKEVGLFLVSTGVTKDAPNYPPSTWLEREQWTAPVLIDNAKGAAATAFGLNGYPYFVAIDASGKVVARASGEITMETFDAMVAKAQAGSA